MGAPVEAGGTPSGCYAGHPALRAILRSPGHPRSPGRSPGDAVRDAVRAQSGTPTQPRRGRSPDAVRDTHSTGRSPGHPLNREVRSPGHPLNREVRTAVRDTHSTAKSEPRSPEPQSARSPARSPGHPPRSPGHPPNRSPEHPLARWQPSGCPRFPQWVSSISCHL